MFVFGPQKGAALGGSVAGFPEVVVGGAAVVAVMVVVEGGGVRGPSRAADGLWH